MILFKGPLSVTFVCLAVVSLAAAQLLALRPATLSPRSRAVLTTGWCVIGAAGLMVAVVRFKYL